GEIGTARLLAGLQARGHRVLMLFRDRTIADRAAEHGIPVGVQLIGGDILVPDAIRFALRLKAERPDALILTTFKKIFLAGSGARMAQVPRVIQRVVLAGDTPARGQRYRFAVSHLVDKVVLNAESLLNPFREELPPSTREKIEVVVDGVSAPVRSDPSGTLRRRLGIPANCHVIGTVTRLARQKRLERLIGAIAVMSSDTHCIIAGEGNERGQLEDLCRNLGVMSRVHFVGFQKNIGDVLDALDLFVISSEREGMANSMLEAMAFGVPVISTLVSGAEEALLSTSANAAPGIIVSHSAEAIAAAAEPLLKDVAQRKAMGEAGRARVRDAFSFERMVDRWEEHLQSAKT
ncbi:MAG TPA: glycosyltransferase, partial [Gemmatimonadaceae bacterium]|nr:glycosyltransferase [Gemmatimonadaceae bacterium]